MLRKPFSQKQIHDRIADEIEHAGYSQDMIGWRLDKVKSTVNSWKNRKNPRMEKRVPDHDTLCQLADILGVDVSYLYGFTDIERMEYNDAEAVHDAAAGATDKLRRVDWFSSVRVHDSEAVRYFDGLSKRIGLRMSGVLSDRASAETDRD